MEERLHSSQCIIAGLTVESAIRGLYPIIDTAACSKAGVNPEDFARAISRTPITVAQFRHKGPYTRDVFEQAERIGKILRRAGMAYVINDRSDVAMMAGADGVHLGQEDLAPSKVRPVVGSSVWIGYSTHNLDQLRDADHEPADYLAFGPVFATGSKEKPDPVVGAELLAAARRLTTKPLVAIGGITRANAGAVLAAGADALAVISDLLGDDLESRLQEWLTLTQPRQPESKG
jgi:thiamine-phosphate pyrophosphorylase